MLALSRKPKESIDIEGVGKITIVAVQGNKVKLGIDLDRKYRVLRSELLSEFHTPSDESISTEHPATL